MGRFGSAITAPLLLLAASLLHAQATDPVFRVDVDLVRLDILASRNALPGDFTRIIQLIEEGKIDTKPWITHHAPFEGMIDVFDSWTKPETGVIKAIVEMK